RRLDHCLRRGWDAAAALLVQQIGRAVEDAGHELSQLRRDVAFTPDDQPPHLPGVLAELDQLHEEFDHVEVTERGRLLTVHIEALTLEDVYLGPFAIELDL